MKKILIVIAVLAVLGVIFSPEISGMAASYAMKPENSAKEWAPGLAYSAGRMNLRFFRYKSATAIFKKAKTVFPNAEWSVDVDYDLALCQEKMGETTEAIKQYRAFALAHPNHRWSEQAGKRADTLEEMNQ